jgi:TonB family protein
METVVQPLAEAELHLLTDWSEPDSARRHRVAAVSSILANIGLILFFIWLPAGTRPPEEPTPERHVTTLIDPPTPLTQKAPNKSKVTNEFNAAEVRPRQRVVVPPSPPPVEHAAQPKPFNPPPMPAPKGGSAAAPAAPPDIPKANTPVQAAPNLDLSKLTAPAPVPPQIQTEEKPKVAFENATAQTPISAGHGLVPIPGNGISEAIHQAARGNLPGGQVVGDSGAISGLGGGGIRVPSAPGLQGSAIELKSDPMGVDFRPYLSQILAAVRRNWMNVMPESVLRLGRRGKTAILFRISRTGGVTKLVIAVPSGSEPLDRAAVAGISASVPFPPLPADFKGEDIVLQFNFAYNMPRQ